MADNPGIGLISGPPELPRTSRYAMSAWRVQSGKLPLQKWMKQLLQKGSVLEALISTRKHRKQSGRKSESAET